MKKCSLLLLFLFLYLFGGSQTVAPAGAIIAPDLADAVAGLDPNAKIRIFITLRGTWDPGACQDQWQSISRKERQKRVCDLLKKDMLTRQRALLQQIKNLSRQGAVDKVTSLWVVNAIVCEATASAIQILATHPDVDFIGYDRLIQAIDPEEMDLGPATSGPSDEIPVNVLRVKADSAWLAGYTGQNVILAILDSGVKYTHVDLAGHMWTTPAYPYHGYDFYNNDNNPIDDHGHGTICAGIAAGDGTAGSQTGIAPDALIMALKVLNNTASGYQTDVWQAVQFAMEQGADVMNLSLQFILTNYPGYKAAWRTCFNNALTAGMIAAIATGNYGTSVGSIPPPNNIAMPGQMPPPWLHPDQTLTGGLSSCVCCGATDNADTIVTRSGYGPVTWASINGYNDYPYNPGIGLIRPDLVAPCQNKTTTISSNTAYQMTGPYTSFSTPMVAGAMAVLLSKNYNLTPAEVDQYLELNAYPIRSYKHNRYGAGRLDVYAAVSAAPAPTGPVFSAFPSTKDFGAVALNDSSRFKTFLISNAGSDTLKINSGGIYLSGSNPGDFSITGSFSYPIHIPAFGSFSFQVAFTPVTVGEKSAQISITDNTGAHAIPVSGSSCIPLGPPFLENFDGVTPPLLPSHWGRENHYLFDWYTATYMSGHSGTQAATSAFVYNNAFQWIDADQWLFTPPVEVIAGKSYKLKFWTRSYDETYLEKMRVEWGYFPDSLAMTHTLINLTAIDSAVYLPDSAVFTAPMTNNIYLGFHHYNADAMVLNLDDIRLTTTPTLTTATVTAIDTTTASSGGNIPVDGGEPVTARGICWNTSGNPTILDDHTSDGSGTGSFSSLLTGLEPSTEYYVRSYATNGVGTTYGNQVIFKTSKHLQVRIFLEGLYDPATETMLKAQDEFGDHFPGTIADTMTFSLGRSTPPHDFLHDAHGTAIHTDGFGDVSVPSLFDASYFLVMIHRNSIETWSANPIDFSGQRITYHFTDQAAKAYGNNMQQMSPGIYAVYAGDGNQDGMVDTNDMGDIDNDACAFTVGYVLTDINGDGIVDCNDLAITENNMMEFVGKMRP